jgi:hypothetical protein
MCRKSQQRSSLTHIRKTTERPKRRTLTASVPSVLLNAVIAQPNAVIPKPMPNHKTSKDWHLPAAPTSDWCRVVSACRMPLGTSSTWNSDTGRSPGACSLPLSCSFGQPQLLCSDAVLQCRCHNMAQVTPVRICTGWPTACIPCCTY